MCRSGGSGGYMEETEVKLKKQKSGLDLRDVIMEGVFKPCTHVCKYIKKALLVLYSVVQ